LRTFCKENIGLKWRNTDRGEKIYNDELNSLYYSTNIIREIK